MTAAGFRLWAGPWRLNFHRTAWFRWRQDFSILPGEPRIVVSHTPYLYNGPVVRSDGSGVHQRR